MPAEIESSAMILLALSFLLAPVLWTQAPAPKEVPVSEEPSHQLVLENQYTRTYRVEVAPGKATLLHRHDNDYVFVALGDAHISNEVLGRPPVDQGLKDGDVNFAAGGFAHVARNVSQRPFQNVTIEILRKSNKRICGFSDVPRCPIGSHDGYAAETILETDAVKVTEEQLAPGSMLPNRLADHMMVALTNVDLKNEAAGQGGPEIIQNVGEVRWVKAASEQGFKNVVKAPAKFLVVEFR